MQQQHNSIIQNMMNCPRVCDLFPVDLGVDLRALQPEITQCKRRFQQDLWNTICNRVLQEQSSWKKDGKKDGSKEASKEGSKTKSDENKGEKTEEEDGGGGGGGGETKEDEPPKEEEEENKPEESGENDNNALMMMRGGGGGGFGNWSNSGGGGRMSRRRPQQQQQQPARRPQPVRRGTSSSQQGYRPNSGPTGRHLTLAQPPSKPHSRPPPPQQQQQRRSQQQRMSGDAGELSNFLSRIRPQEGVLDWRDGGCPRPQQQQRLLSRDRAHEPTNANHARSYSATSRREILGCYDNDAAAGAAAEDEFVDVSEAFEDAKVFYGGGGCCGQSDGETATYYMGGGVPNRSNDGASHSTLASREFVPLMVGNWWGCATRQMPL